MKFVVYTWWMTYPACWRNTLLYPPVGSWWVTFQCVGGCMWLYIYWCMVEDVSWLQDTSVWLRWMQWWSGFGNGLGDEWYDCGDGSSSSALVNWTWPDGKKRLLMKAAYEMVIRRQVEIMALLAEKWGIEMRILLVPLSENKADTLTSVPNQWLKDADVCVFDGVRRAWRLGWTVTRLATYSAAWHQPGGGLGNCGNHASTHCVFPEDDEEVIHGDENVVECQWKRGRSLHWRRARLRRRDTRTFQCKRSTRVHRVPINQVRFANHQVLLWWTWSWVLTV